MPHNLLFRWFIGLGIGDPVWDHSTFSNSRGRLLDADIAAKFLGTVLRHQKVKRYLSDNYFSVDGTMVEAWGSLKTFRAKDGGNEPPSPGHYGERDLRGEERASTTSNQLSLRIAPPPLLGDHVAKAIIGPDYDHT